MSLIDNVLVNSTNSIIHSGVLKSKVSHHNPIFSVIECKQKCSSNELPALPKYDYCESNIENFLDDIKMNVCQDKFPTNEAGFDNFVTVLNQKIDFYFQTEPATSKIISKRNRFINPWITGEL